MKRLRTLLRSEDGDIEEIPAWSILIVFMIMLGSVVFFVGRGVGTAQSVQAASWAAARDASLSRSQAAAIPNAHQAAALALSDTPCVSLEVEITGNGLTTRLGEVGTVTARVTCTVSTGDILFPGLPGTITVTKEATSPVDPYRER